MLGSEATALNKAGKVTAPWELPFILVMETESGEAPDRERNYGLGNVHDGELVSRAHMTQSDIGKDVPGEVAFDL